MREPLAIAEFVTEHSNLLTTMTSDLAKPEENVHEDPAHPEVDEAEDGEEDGAAETHELGTGDFQYDMFRITRFSTAYRRRKEEEKEEETKEEKARAE